MVTPGNPITQADMDALANLANNKLRPLVVNAIASDQNGWASQASWTYDAAGVLTNVTGKNFYDIPVNRTPGTHGIMAPQQPPYLFDPAVANWHDEFNRIRGDVMEMVLNFNYGLGAANIFQNSNSLVSGPWIVGVNDPSTWVDPQNGMFPSFHMLFATFKGTSAGCAATNFTIFKNVKFFFWDSVAAPFGLSVASGRGIITTGSHGFGASPTTVNFNIAMVAQLAGTVQAVIKIELTGPVGAPPAVTGFTITDTSTFSVTWTTDVSPNGAGKFLLIGTVNQAISASTKNLIFTVKTPAGYTWVTDVSNNVTWFLQSNILFNTSGTQHGDINCINVADGSPYIAVADIPANSEFVVNGIHASAVFMAISPTAGAAQTVPGVWVANTLPVPGRNVFVDQDLPPFIDQAYVNGIPITPNNVLVAISQARAANGLTGFLPLASSMRCMVTKATAPAEAPFNQVQSARPASPTPWPVLRDTDLIPFDYGFNQNESLYTNTGTAAAGGLVFVSGGVVVQSAATRVALNVVAAGTGLKAWRNDGFGNHNVTYGTPITSGVRIFIGSEGVIDPTDSGTYDFFYDAAAVVIPDNAPPGYLALILNGTMNYAVQCISGPTVAIDVVEEVDYNGAPANRIFSPPLCECFSYSIDGSPRIFDASVSNYNFNKRIPTSGFSIYKIRATRLPVVGANGLAITPTIGPAITATVGSLQGGQDGDPMFFIPFVNGFSNFTITIPLNARDSGDVPVFWPVLAGSELMYQCDTQIILEAWVDFQPIFFNSLYGVESGPIVPPGVQYLFYPTAFQYGLGFVNKFDQTQAGYPYKNLETLPVPVPGYSIVQYPMSAEVYNDLMELLNLM